MFQSKKKPQGICKSLLKHVRIISGDTPIEEAITEEERQDRLSKSRAKVEERVLQIRLMLYGDDVTAAKVPDIQKFRDELTNDCEIVIVLLRRLALFELKTQKEIVKIITFFISRGRQNEFNDYFLAHPEIVDILMDGYGNTNIAAHCGPILRECVVHKKLCSELMLKSVDVISRLVMLCTQPCADLASDAFITLKALCLTHKGLAHRFFDEHYDVVFNKLFRSLLETDNIVVQKKTLALMHEIFLEKKHRKTLVRYVASDDNLKRIMNMLRIKKVVLQFAVYDVFTLFLANTEKTPEVERILYKNRDILKGFLSKLTKETEDEEFEADKLFLLKKLGELQPPAARRASSSSPPSSPPRRLSSSSPLHHLNGESESKCEHDFAGEHRSSDTRAVLASYGAIYGYDHPDLHHHSHPEHVPSSHSGRVALPRAVALSEGFSVPSPAAHGRSSAPVSPVNAHHQAPHHGHFVYDYGGSGSGASGSGLHMPPQYRQSSAPLHLRHHHHRSHPDLRHHSHPDLRHAHSDLRYSSDPSRRHAHPYAYALPHAAAGS